MPGALPCFEAFGGLPTDLVREDGLVGGRAASEVLDMIIIPGGSLVESRTLKTPITQQILKMADTGKFVLGICSGFQVLSKGTDIGRLSAAPIMREGLGLLDADFTPLICTDQVAATVVGESMLTDELGREVTGFHCHTYGDLHLHKAAKPILVSHVKHLNYFKHEQDLVSGVANKEGNVVGIIVHALLDQNPLIIEGISKSLNITPTQLTKIHAANAKLLENIRGEVGVGTNVWAKKAAAKKAKTTSMLVVTALGSGSGKTFIVTGIAGALRKRGVNVGVVKVGGDIRDIVPALYLTKEPMQEYSSIRICESGWKELFGVAEQASKNYDLVLVEGAMSAFTGLLMDKVEGPSSTAEVAGMLGAPTVVVVACDNEGIEGALVNALGYVNLMRSLGVKVKGVIFNKAYLQYLTEETKALINKSFENAGVELLGIVPRIDVVGRGSIPEVEIRYEEFGAKAIEMAEQHMNLERIAAIAAPPITTHVDCGEFVEKFRNLLATNFGFNANQNGRECRGT